MKTVTFKGKEVHLSGILPKKGNKAPSFELAAQDLKEVSLNSFSGKKKILNIFVSLDTSVCSKSIHAFYEKCRSKPDLVLLNISMDLPFAAGRFCKSEKLESVVTLSAFRSRFAEDYGIKIVDGPLKGLSARAVLVLSEDDTVLYAELVSEITEEPNYSAALQAIG